MDIQSLLYGCYNCTYYLKGSGTCPDLSALDEATKELLKIRQSNWESMALNMDINKEMYIWVDAVFHKNEKESIVFDGNSFDDEMGFGMGKRCYEGEFIQLSKDGSVKKIGEISMIHYSRFGLKWIVNTDNFMMKLPFLLTSNLAMNHVYSGEIHIILTDRAKKKLDQYSDTNISVISENCIANLSIHERSVFMDIFTDKINFKFADLPKEHFCFEGYHDCIGKINI